MSAKKKLAGRLFKLLDGLKVYGDWVGGRQEESDMLADLIVQAAVEEVLAKLPPINGIPMRDIIEIDGLTGVFRRVSSKDKETQ